MCSSALLRPGSRLDTLPPYQNYSNEYTDSISFAVQHKLKVKTLVPQLLITRHKCIPQCARVKQFALHLSHLNLVQSKKLLLKNENAVIGAHTLVWHGVGVHSAGGTAGASRPSHISDTVALPSSESESLLHTSHLCTYMSHKCTCHALLASSAHSLRLHHTVIDTLQRVIEETIHNS